MSVVIIGGNERMERQYKDIYSSSSSALKDVLDAYVTGGAVCLSR